MMKGGHGQTNQLRDINWGALDHVSCAPQLKSCNYCVCVCVSEHLSCDHDESTNAVHSSS